CLLNRAVLSRRHLLERSRQVVREFDRSRHTTTVPFQYDATQADTDEKRHIAIGLAVVEDRSNGRRRTCRPITRYTTGLVRRYPCEMWEADDRRVTFRFTSPG